MIIEKLENERDRYIKLLEESKRVEFKQNTEITRLLASWQRDSDLIELERKLEMKIKVSKLKPLILLILNLLIIEL